MASFTALYDACILYPAPIRDLFMHLAMTGLFRAKWTDDIHREWKTALLRDRSDLTASQLDRTQDLMDAHVLDCKITGYEDLIPGLDLPDANDRHVLAAAIRARADVIVTLNLKDFPADRLRPYGVEAQHPDDFILHLFDLSPAAVRGSFRQQRQNLRNPPVSTIDLLNTLEKNGLVRTVSALRLDSEGL